MSSLLVSLLTFMGLVALGVSEVRGFGSRSGWLTLLLRWLGWLCLYYLPIFFVAVPFIRNFVLWSLNPGEGLTKAFDYRDVGSDLRWKRAAWLPYVQHTAWVAVHTLLVLLPLNEKESFGLIPIYGFGNAMAMPIGIMSSVLLAPPLVSRSYAFRLGPATIFFPIIGFLVLTTMYVLLRRSLFGPQLGVALPLLLSGYELLGTAVVNRLFTQHFVTNYQVRHGYVGTNQGLVASIAICNLHAMAEGARLTLLYLEVQTNQNLAAILLPILSGVGWNVMARIGGLDRILHVVFGWQPRNSNKFLRESGYCAGYFRFGAICSMLLARLCTGAALPDLAQLMVLAGILGAEVLEDLLSYGFWYAGVDLSPAARPLSEKDVQEMATAQISRCATLRSSSTPSRGSLVAVVPQPEDPDTTPAATSTIDQKSMIVACWKLRVAYDFKFRAESFEHMPFWCHLLPAAMAQFHTIFAMIIFAGGLDKFLGFSEQEGFNGYGSAVLLWPSQHS